MTLKLSSIKRQPDTVAGSSALSKNTSHRDLIGAGSLASNYSRVSHKKPASAFRSRARVGGADGYYRSADSCATPWSVRSRHSVPYLPVVSLLC